jgi:hypothetical protein
MAKSLAPNPTPPDAGDLSYEDLLQGSTGASSTGTPVTLGQASGRAPEFGDRTVLFLLAHSPRSWDLVFMGKDEKPVLLPVLSNVLVLAGVNGTKTPKAGQAVSPVEVVTRVTGRGMRVLQDQLPEYLRSHPGRNGQIGYFLAWEKVNVFDDGTYAVDVDKVARDKYRLSLVDRRIVNPPRTDVVRKLLRAAEASVRRMANAPKRDDDGELLNMRRRRVAGLRALLNERTTSTEEAADG